MILCTGTVIYLLQLLIVFSSLCPIQKRHEQAKTRGPATPAMDFSGLSLCLPTTRATTFHKFASCHVAPCMLTSLPFFSLQNSNRLSFTYKHVFRDSLSIFMCMKECLVEKVNLLC